MATKYLSDGVLDMVEKSIVPVRGLSSLTLIEFLNLGIFSLPSSYVG